VRVPAPEPCVSYSLPGVAGMKNIEGHVYGVYSTCPHVHLCSGPRCSSCSVVRLARQAATRFSDS
jgi:hypothetical protein